MGEVDLFFHLWDYNSHPQLRAEFIDGRPKEIPLSEDEKARIVSTLKPKKFLFESKKDVSQTGPTNVVSWFAHEQFYSLWRAATLKREHEMENDFEYDVVVRLRSDLFFSGGFTSPVRADTMLPSTIHSVHNSIDATNGVMRIGDIFFMSDSLTYDHIAMFYDSFRYIDALSVMPSEPIFPPELALFYYCASIGVDNVPLPHIDFKIMRDAEHLARAGKLEQYETV